MSERELELEYQLEVARADLARQQRNIYRMHAAAWGGIGQSPARGWIEDIEDLYTTCEFWKRAAEQALRLWERAQDELDDLKTPRGAE